MNRLGFLLVLCLAILTVSCGQTMADPAPAPSAFLEIPTSGLTMLPAGFADGQLTYTLSLSSDAYIESGGVHFPITQIWGFFAVNKTGLDAYDVTANGPDIGEWKWDQNPKNDTQPSVAGWLNASKGQALTAPASGSVSKQFTYNWFTFSGIAPVMGCHITISIPQGAVSPFAGGGLTSSVIPKSVPEPSSFLALFAGAMGLVGICSRHRRS